MRRGMQPWRDRPTDRQKVISELWAEKIKEETGVVVDPEIVRAVRWTNNRHRFRELFADGELEQLTAKAKLDRKLAYAASLVEDARREFESTATQFTEVDWNTKTTMNTVVMVTEKRTTQSAESDDEKEDVSFG